MPLFCTTPSDTLAGVEGIAMVCSALAGASWIAMAILMPWEGEKDLHLLKDTNNFSLRYRVSLTFCLKGICKN